MVNMLKLYSTTAILVLTVLLLFVGLELMARIALTVATVPSIKGRLSHVLGRRHDLVAHYLALPYYAKQDWAAQYWLEHRLALKKRYHPYVIWRSPPFTGTTLNIDQDGVRQTPAARCVPGAYKVFAFGGSAMWGWGAPDWGTIPAYLQAKLQSRHNEPVCVVNFGENAYVATQNLIQLLLQLELGNVPDLVIFYDGVNEVLAASQSGQPVVHHNFSDIVERFQNPPSPLLTWLQNLSVIRVLSVFVPASNATRRANILSDTDTDQLADTIVQAYINNYAMVTSLAQTYKFNYYFFWQPYILFGHKVLTPEEQGMITGLHWILTLDPSLVRLFKQTYDRVIDAAQRSTQVHVLVDVFDRVEAQLWMDTWGHVTPVGNEIVARVMVEVITSRQERTLLLQSE